MEIYAEISRKMLGKIESGSGLNLPSNIYINRKQGSRACYFECDESHKNDLISFLDNNGMSWQIMSEEISEPEIKEDKYNKNKKSVVKSSGFSEFKAFKDFKSFKEFDMFKEFRGLK